ncbi:hypothetical protein, partial [Levilactobacillus brevis]
TRLANTVSGYADKFVQKFGLNLQSTNRLISNGENQRKKDIYQAISCPINLLLHKVIYEH